MKDRSNRRTFFGQTVRVVLGAIGGILGAILGLLSAVAVYCAFCGVIMFLLEGVGKPIAPNGLVDFLGVTGVSVGVVGLLVGGVLGARFAASAGSKLPARVPPYGYTTTAGIPETSIPSNAADGRSRAALGGLLGAVIAAMFTCSGWVLLCYPRSEPRTEAEALTQSFLAFVTLLGIVVLGPVAAIAGAIVGALLAPRLRRKVRQQLVSGSCPFKTTKRNGRGSP